MKPLSSFSIVELSLVYIKLKLIFLYYVSYIFRVEEYINQGKDGFLVDPDPDLIYTKRKLAKQNESGCYKHRHKHYHKLCYHVFDC